jgi:hypothetical protein
MREVQPRQWAGAKLNQDFFCIETYSGYGGGTDRDPKGSQSLLPSDASNESVGAALLEALSRSRFVLPEPRKDVWIHPAATFDLELSDYELSAERYKTWIADLMHRYGYKTKRVLFKDMNSCTIECDDGFITIQPSHHDKLEGWGREKGDGIEDVVIPADSSPEAIGAALRLAFSRCTG